MLITSHSGQAHTDFPVLALLMYWLLSTFSGKNVSGLSWEWSKLWCSHPINTHDSKTPVCVATLSFREHHGPMSQCFLLICRTQGFHAWRKSHPRNSQIESTTWWFSDFSPPHSRNSLHFFQPLQVTNSSHVRFVCLPSFFCHFLSFFWRMSLGSFTPCFSCVPTTHPSPSLLGHSIWKYEGAKN